MARRTFCEREANPLRTLGGTNRSRCGAVRVLSRRNEPSAHFGSNRSRCGAVHILNFDSPKRVDGQLTGRRRKHYHAPAKQDTSKRPPLERKSQWHGNENTQPSKTLRLRNEITRNAATDTIHARAQRIQRSKTHRQVMFLRQSQWHGNFFHMRTLADAFERSRTLSHAFGHTRADQRTRPYPQTPLNNGNPSLRIRERNAHTFFSFESP